MRADDYYYDAADSSTSRDAAQPKAFAASQNPDSIDEAKKSHFPNLTMAFAALPVLAITAFGFNHISGIFSDGEAAAESTAAVSTVMGAAQSSSSASTATTSSTNTASSTKITLPSTAKVSFGSSSHATQASGKGGSVSFSGDSEGEGEDD